MIEYNSIPGARNFFFEWLSSPLLELSFDLFDFGDALIHLLDFAFESHLDLVKQGLLLSVECGVLQSERLNLGLRLFILFFRGLKFDLKLLDLCFLALDPFFSLDVILHFGHVICTAQANACASKVIPGVFNVYLSDHVLDPISVMLPVPLPVLV